MCFSCMNAFSLQENMQMYNLFNDNMNSSLYEIKEILLHYIFGMVPQAHYGNKLDDFYTNICLPLKLRNVLRF